MFYKKKIQEKSVMLNSFFILFVINFTVTCSLVDPVASTGKKWAFLAAGSKYYSNYRHQVNFRKENNNFRKTD